LAVGVQPLQEIDEFGSIRIGGAIYLYDTLPGGAGYARDISADFVQILNRAKEMAADCPGNCNAACYRCLLDYANQRYHGLLDRRLAGDIINFILTGTLPCLSHNMERKLLDQLGLFQTEDVDLQAYDESKHGVFDILTLKDGRKAVIKPVHSLRVDDSTIRLPLASHTGLQAVVLASSIELDRQPFAVWQLAFQEAR